jgi:hypothetical protein
MVCTGSVVPGCPKIVSIRKPVTPRAKMLMAVPEIT